jgi:tetratricopeptide (TPR) repeat protein
MKQLSHRAGLIVLLLLALTNIAAAEKEDLLNQCTQAKDQNEFTQAVSYCTQALDLDSDYIDALFWRGFSQIQLGKYDDAINDMSRVLKLQPLDVEAWSHRAAAYRRSGKFTQALSDANRALEIDPQDLGGHMTGH